MKERILAGAERAFIELGYADTRVEDILRAAGVSRPTFYKAFRNKDDVFETLSEQVHANMLETLAQALGQPGDGGDKLELTIRAFLRWRAESGAISVIFDAEVRNGLDYVLRHRQHVYGLLVERWEQELDELGRGRVDPLVFETLIAGAEYISATFPERSKIRPEDIERRFDVLFRLFSGALALEGEPLPPIPRPPG